MPDRGKDVNTILEERGNVYGSYEEGLKFRLEAEQLINRKYNADHGEDMPEEMMFLFNDVLSKLGRLASCPTHIDSWKDLAGYSVLVERIVQGRQDEKADNTTP